MNRVVRIGLFVFVLLPLLVVSCRLPHEAADIPDGSPRRLDYGSADPDHVEMMETRPEFVPELDFGKVVFLGDSLCAGYQSDGLYIETQEYSYPALVAGKLGLANDFQQPLIASPGISSEPGQGQLEFDPSTGVIGRNTYTDVGSLLINVGLLRPYDNLGVPGAKLEELLTRDTDDFFQIVLRGRGSQVEQLEALEPTLVVLWAGNNDVLAAAGAGGDPDRITPIAEFREHFNAVIEGIDERTDADIIVFNIPDVADIPLINALDERIFAYVPFFGKVPVVFDSDFRPVNFGAELGIELYIPLLTEEGGIGHRRDPVRHVLLFPFVQEYLGGGLGVPDEAAIRAYLTRYLRFPRRIAAALARRIVAGMEDEGLIASGTPISGKLTITRSEEWRLKATTNAYNRIIWETALSRRPIIPVISSRLLLSRLSRKGIAGFSGKFVWFDPVNTAFSLDGVHPNNAGYGIIANTLIGVMNLLAPEEQIGYVGLEQFRGQYVRSGSLVAAAGP